MKSLLLLAALAAPLSFATTEQAPAPAAAPMDEALAILEQCVSNLEELADITLSITDKASADAAAPRIKQLITESNALQEKASANPPSDKREMPEEYFKRIIAAFGKISEAGNDTYGSEALEDALKLRLKIFN